MEIDIHLSPFSWQLLHSCLTPALRSRVAASQTPWKPFVWPINTHCAAIVILQQCRHTEKREKEMEQRSRKVQMLPRRKHLPGQPSFAQSKFHWTPFWGNHTFIVNKDNLSRLQSTLMFKRTSTKKSLNQRNLIHLSKGNQMFFVFFKFVMNFDDRILLDRNSATLTHIRVSSLSQEFWKQLGVEVDRGRLFSTTLIKIYLLILPLQIETFSASAIAFETLHSAKLAPQPFKWRSYTFWAYAY